MNFKLTTFIVLFVACAPKTPVDVATESPVSGLGLSDPLPFDPGITVGTLDNGLRYFIEPNAYPRERVELRLVLPVGSLQEDPDQLGLAHFLEHMAFNGTTHFEAGELVSFLESTGVQFGAHLNAATSFDSTTYMLTLPSDDPELLDQGLLILKDWAQGMQLGAEEVEKERGVVLEEWRRAQGSGFRVGQQTVPLVLGERYGSRWPIGTEESLQSFDPAALHRFYQDWYRPDLMSVIVVGDVDVSEIETRIQASFSELTGPSEPRSLIEDSIPEHPEDAIMVITDPEAPMASISLSQTRSFQWGGDLEFLRDYVAQTLALQILNERYGFLARTPNPPILGAGAGAQVLNHRMRLETLGVGTREDRVEEGLEAALIELRRASLHGFTEAEWQRALTQTRSMWETIRAEGENTDSSTHAAEIVRHVLTDEFMPGTELEYQLVQHILSHLITREDCQRAIRSFLQDDRVLVLTLPEKEGLEPPSDDALRAIMERVDSSSPAAPEQEEASEPLVSEVPEPGRIVSEEYIEELNLTIWTLSNGVEVQLKPTDLKEDEVVFTSHGWGGLSRVSDDNFYDGEASPAIALASGLGAHNIDSLVRLLSGSTAVVRPRIQPLSQGFSGHTAPRDLETLFQLIHLWATEPRFDDDAFERLRDAWIQALQNREMTPGTAFSDRRGELRYGGHYRTQPRTLETLEGMRLEDAEAVYRERFADLSNHHFFFVGNVDLEEMRPLVETWLGSLPSGEGEESWQDSGIRYSEGVQTDVVYSGTEPKAQVSIDFMGDYAYSKAKAYQMNSAGTVLEQILRERLREDLGGTYSVSVGVSAGRIPVEEYRFTISFGCAPERADELKAVVYSEIERLKTEAVSEDAVAGLIETSMRELETNRQRNEYWRTVLYNYHQRDEDPLNHFQIEERFQSLTAEQIQATFAAMFDMDHRIELILMPESYAP